MAKNYIHLSEYCNVISHITCLYSFSFSVCELCDWEKNQCSTTTANEPDWNKLQFIRRKKYSQINYLLKNLVKNFTEQKNFYRKSFTEELILWIDRQRTNGNICHTKLSLIPLGEGSQKNLVLIKGTITFLLKMVFDSTLSDWIFLNL